VGDLLLPELCGVSRVGVVQLRADSAVYVRRMEVARWGCSWLCRMVEAGLT
jgi:hypothetical protein